VEVKPWPLRQPGADLSLRGRPAVYGVHVSAVVVDDHEHVEIWRDLLFNPPQETQELLVPVPGFALGGHRTGGHVQGGKQGGGAVADLVVSDTFDVAQTHGQQRLGAIDGLDMRFLVNTEHNCLVGRVEVEANDVSYLFNKEGIVGELERLLAVGLQGEGLQPAVGRILEMPVAAANERAVHCVLPSAGLLCRALLITSATLSSS
jgi:hypothetical protein